MHRRVGARALWYHRVTAICGGGSSAPKAGLPSIIDPAVTLIAELLSAKGGKWVAGALGFQLINPLDISTFCAGDPPALPTFTSDETNAILQLQFGADFVSGIAKLKDWILHILWYEFCECTSGALATYTAPSMPAGTPVLLPPAGTIATPCASSGPNPLEQGGGSYSLRAHVVPNALVKTALRVTVTGVPTSGGGSPTDTTVIFRDIKGDDMETPYFLINVPAAGGEVVKLYQWPVDAASVYANVYFSGPGSSIHGVTLEEFCNGALPGETAQPCCPPDEATQASLDLILKMVTLIQRQAVPFAYVYGSNHTGLTGDGEISPVSSLIGVSVDVTALGSAVGSAAGTPEHLFDAGYVTLGTADGWLRSRRIDADGTLELAPPGVGAITRVGYTLAPGVTVSVRELTREP